MSSFSGQTILVQIRQIHGYQWATSPVYGLQIKMSARQHIMASVTFK